MEIERSDAFDYLHSYIDRMQNESLELKPAKFDLVILDPPNLGGERANVPSALRFYERLVYQAAQVCASPGYLFVASCTGHIGEHDLLDAVRRALRWAKRPAKLLSIGGQSADHPGHLALHETRYLRSVLLQLD